MNRTPILLILLAALCGLLLWILPLGPSPELQQRSVGQVPATEPTAPREASPELADRESADREAATVPGDIQYLTLKVETANGELCPDAMVRVWPDPEELWLAYRLADQEAEEWLAVDANGELQLEAPPPAVPSVLVVAKSAYGVGHLQLPASRWSEPQPSAVLRLQESAFFTVLLEDAERQPVADQQVCWWASPDNRERVLATARTDSDGRAIFHGIDHIRQNATQAGTVFGVTGAFVTRPMRILQEEDVLRGGFTLRCPPTGSVKVVLRDEQGQLLGDAWPCKLAYRWEGGSEPSVYQVDSLTDGAPGEIQNGRVVFPVVEAGHSWQFAVIPQFSAPPLLFEFDGPASEGEHRAHELTIADSQLSFHRLRLRNAEGQALAHQEVSMELRVESAQQSRRVSALLTADAEGFIQLEIPFVEEPRSWSLKVEAREHPDGLRGSTRGDVTTAKPELPDTLTLRSLPIVVSGEVVTVDGKTPQGEIRLGLGTLDAAGEYSQDLRFTNTVREAGQFELRAERVPERRLVVSARVEGATHWTDVEFQPGQRDVRIEVPSQGWVQLNAGDNDPQQVLGLHLICSLPDYPFDQPLERDPFSSQAPPRGERIARDSFELDEETGRSAPLSARCGSLLLTVLDEFGRILHQQPFELHTAHTREQPLLLTLPPLNLALYQLQLRKPDGGAPQYASCQFRGPADDFCSLIIRDGVASFISNQLPPSATIRSRGFLDEELHWAGQQQVLTLLADPDAAGN